MEFLRYDLVQADGVLHVLEANSLGAPVCLQAVRDPVFLGAKILELQRVLLAEEGEFEFWPERKIGNRAPLYIEGQFFQSDYGADSLIDTVSYGPMAAMTDVTKSPTWEKYSKELGLGDTPQEAPRYTQV